MEKESHITPEIRALIGQEVTSHATEPVDAGKIRRFAKSLGFDHPSYYAMEDGQPVAPLTFVFSVNHDSLVDMDPSGRPKNRFSLSSAVGVGLRGGNKYQFFQPVKVGDQIRIHRKITDIKERHGRSGPMLFVTYDLKYTNQNGELLGLNTETLIFRMPQDSKGGR